MFEFKKCVSKDGVEFLGLFEIEPKIFGDNRGYFFESYNERDFFEAGLNVQFVQDNQSFSKRGVIRALHFQKHHSQGKLLSALQGLIFSVAVDLRNESETFGKYFSVILDSKKHNEFYIPKGFAHGFCVLSDSATLFYKCTDFYEPDDEDGIIWNDKTLGIDWPTFEGGTEPILSEKDKKNPAFDATKKYFDLNGKWIE